MEVIQEGNTVEEAVALVLKEKGWTKEQVQVECIQMNRSGFFRKQKAIVKVILNELEINLVNEWSTEKSREWVTIQNGQLLVHPHLNFENYQLHPPMHTKLFVDQKPVISVATLESMQMVLIEQIPFEDQLEIIVSENRKTVHVKFKEHGGYSLKPFVKWTDTELNVHFEETRETSTNWTAGRVEQKLKLLNIVYGIQLAELASWLLQPSKWDQPVLVAEGIERIDGVATKFYPKYLERNPVKKIAADSKEKVDYYGFSPIQTAKPNDILIEITPPTSGADGFDVFGKEDKAVPGAVIQMILGNGVHLSADGKSIVADVEGLVDHKDLNISMSPLFTVEGDVGLATGSIRFKGSIVVKGSVHEGMTLEADDNIYVQGSVSDSVIRAGKDVEIHGNVVMSQIITGAQSSKILKQLQWIRQMNETLLGSLVDRGRVMDPSSKPQVHANHHQSALEQKHVFVLKWLSEGEGLLDWSQRDDNIQRLRKWMERAKQSFLGRTEGAHSMEKMEDWLFDEGAELECIWLKQLADPHNASIFNVHMSTILSTGTIQIIGKSSYLSTLIAGEKIVAYEGEGNVRGGTLIAGQSILVKNLGSPSGAHTRCKVLADDGTVGMDTGYPGVYAWIGHHRYLLQQVLKRALIAFDHEKNQMALGVLKEKPKK